MVAGEVRTLAQKSADAAKEIKALIEGTVEKITEGSQQADKAGKAMTEQGEQLRNAVRFFRVEQASALRLR